MNIIDLARLAINHRKPHVQRLVPLIWLAVDGLNRHGIPWRGRYRNQIRIGAAREYYGKLEHNARSRQPPRLELRRSSDSAVLHVIETIDDAIAFRQNPRAWITLS
jgi:hypothetical protein